MYWRHFPAEVELANNDVRILASGWALNCNLGSLLRYLALFCLGALSRRHENELGNL